CKGLRCPSQCDKSWLRPARRARVLVYRKPRCRCRLRANILCKIDRKVPSKSAARFGGRLHPGREERSVPGASHEQSKSRGARRAVLPSRMLSNDRRICSPEIWGPRLACRADRTNERLGGSVV